MINIYIVKSDSGFEDTSPINKFTLVYINKIRLETIFNTELTLYLHFFLFLMWKQVFIYFFHDMIYE